MKTHLSWGAVVALLLLTLWYVAKAKGAADQRQHTTADSLAAATQALDRVLDSAQQARIIEVRSDAARERALQLAQVTQRAAQSRADSLAARLRQAAPDTLRGLLDSLQAAQARAVASLERQRDSAIALFHGKQVAVDRLEQLLASVQQENLMLRGMIARASRKPLLERTPVKVALLAGAYLLGRSGH